MSRSATNTVVTPEAVSLEMDEAGLGSRMAAALFDGMIQAAIGILMFAAIAGMEILDLSPTAGFIVSSLGVFLLLFGYFPLFEGLMNGQTPGKRWTKLRVVQANGQPLTLGPLLVRNLIRIVDFLPAYYMVGSVVIVLTKRSQRLGDLAAGTVVVREPKAPTPVQLSKPSEAEHIEADVDTTRLDDRHYTLVRSFLTRRPELTADARYALASELAGKLRPLVQGGAPAPNDERFLEEIAWSYRSRHASVPPQPRF